MNEYINRIEKENLELLENSAYIEQAYKDLQTERDHLSLWIEKAFKEGFNVGKKFANATDAWLVSYARARGKE